MSSSPSCCKNLWVLISGTATLKSKEFVGKSLNDNADRIINGILYYTRTNNRNLSNRSELRNGIPQKVIDKLTALLHIDQSQANDLVITYLLSDFTGNLKAISAQFCGEQSIQSFIDDVLSFFTTERLYSLLVLKEILSNLHDGSHHPFQDIFKEFMGRTFTADSLINGIINQLVHLNAGCELVQSSEHNSLDVSSPIRERFELNQLMVLALYNFPYDLQHMIQLLNVYADNFRTAYNNVERGSQCEQIALYNSILESLIIVQSMSVSKLFDCIQEERTDHVLLSAPQKLQQLDNSICNLSFSVKSNSIIFLGWIIVRNWEIEGFSPQHSEQVVRRLGSLSVNLGVFQVLNDFFSSNLFERMFGETMVGTILKKITGDLLSTVFNVYQIEKIVGCHEEEVTELLKEIEKDYEVAKITFEKSSESGLLSVLKGYLHCLPSNVDPFIKIATSLATTKHNHQLFQLMSNIEAYKETLPSTSPFIELKSHEFYRCTADRVISPSKIYIRKDQLGKVIGYSSANSTVTIQWMDVNVSAWTIMENVYKKYQESLSIGSMQQVDDNSIKDLTLMNNFCVSIIKSDENLSPEIRELVKLALECFKLMARHARIPRFYLASALELFCALSVCDSSKKEASNFWTVIGEFGIFPYSEGSFLGDDSVAHTLNPSLIGSIVNTVECIKGEYALTISFLNYISTIIDTVVIDDVLISCVTFTLNEIFPQYQLWHYKRIKQKEMIGYHCLTIAYKALKIQKKSNSGKISNTVLKLFSVGRASETLLNMVRAGIIMASESIQDIGVHEALNSEVVVTVKLSLLVLEQVLTLSGSKKEITSSIEHAIFSSRGMVVKTLKDKSAASSQNILLVLAHYVFQNFDPSLAYQAASLMKVLAVRHPLSMMSCLGAEAESVKEHFLAKLDSPTEDIDVKIGILDWLAECVVHQPGILEVFVSQDVSAAEESSVLEIVLRILEEKKNGVVFCPPELHYTSLRFLANFWVNSSLPIITRLKKNPNLWAFITFPFLEPNEQTFLQDFHPKIISCIVRIIAREIFLLQFSSGQDPGFQCVLSFIPSRISALSSYLKDVATSEVIDDGNEESLVIYAWKDLIVSIAQFKPIELSSLIKAEIFTNLLESILKQLQLNGCQNVIGSMTETCLIVVKHWSTSLTPSIERWFALNTNILYVVNESKNNLKLDLLISLESYLTRTILISTKEGTAGEIVNLGDLINPTSDLLLHSLRIVEKVLIEKSSSETIVINLCSTTMCLFNLIATSTSTLSSSWLRSLKTNGLLGHLSGLLHHLLINKLSIDLCQNIISILISISTNPVTAELLVSTTNLDWMRSALKCDYTEVFQSNLKPKQNQWSIIYCLTIKLASTLLMNLKQFFANDALTFVVDNADRMMTCLRRMTSSPSLELLREAKEVLVFLQNLAKFKLLWIANQPVLYEVVVNQISVINHSIASFLVHPNLFLHLLESSSKPSFLSINKNNSVMKQQQPNLDRSFTPSKSLDQGLRVELDPEIEQLLFEISAVTVKFLIEVQPSLEDILSIRKDPSKSSGIRLMLDRRFGEPNIDTENGASFGSVLSIFDHSSASITKAQDGSKRYSIEKLTVLMESSLYLMICQAIISQMDTSIPVRDQQLISRELQTRLSSLKRRVSSSKRTSSASLTPGRNCSTSVIHNQTVTHLIHFLDETCPRSDD